jgi:arsenate reductase
MDQFINGKFNDVITLCDPTAKCCPTFGGQGRRLPWPFEDPAGATGTAEDRWTVFRRIRDGIKRKIEEFLKSESSEIPDAIASFEL